jgi:alkanesulfonate monooxygenase SsuD/methylene tetrahydromethanopterin reductase-like flavin-dependent oxidoreductase (luciferase family)
VTTLGAVFVPQFPPERLRGVARAADEAGLEELWLWEDCFKESGIAAAAAALAWTERLRVGVGLLPVPLRNVALTAMELATMHRLFPDRFSVAVGHGVQGWMEQVGARVESPMTLLREYVSALRALLGGETVTVSGRYVRLDRVALDWPPPSAPAILAGAVGPRSLRLSGEVADGTVLVSSTTPDGVREARALVNEGRAAGDARGAGPSQRSLAGEVTGGHRVVLFAHAATGPDAAARLAGYQKRWGMEPGKVGVAGDAAAVAAAVRSWAAAGADTVVLEPTDDDPDPEGFVRFVGAEVRPLVAG